jgi:hypothetical protein
MFTVDGISAVSTETDYYRTNISELSEWRKEIDRAKIMLDISESPELLMSQSEDNSKIVITENNITNIQNLSSYLGKINSKSDKLILLSNQVENELKAINRCEKVISGFDKIKDKVMID